MGKKRPSVAEQRLAHVRALRDEFFSDEPSLEQQLAQKDERIAHLEREVDLLRAQLRTQRKEPESTAPPSGDAS